MTVAAARFGMAGHPIARTLGAGSAAFSLWTLLKWCADVLGVANLYPDGYAFVDKLAMTMGMPAWLAVVMFVGGIMLVLVPQWAERPAIWLRSSWAWRVERKTRVSRELASLRALIEPAIRSQEANAASLRLSLLAAEFDGLATGFPADYADIYKSFAGDGAEPRARRQFIKRIRNETDNLAADCRQKLSKSKDYDTRQLSVMVQIRTSSIHAAEADSDERFEAALKSEVQRLEELRACLRQIARALRELAAYRLSSAN